MSSPRSSKIFRWIAGGVVVVVLTAAGAGGWFYSKLRASLPQLDGEAPLAGLSSPLTITRDGQGVPTIRGATRVDVARGLGWVHAQDRFFQMDLLRRTAAGELAEIIGGAALPLDRENRMHGFRARAQEQLARLSPSERAVIIAYTTGVNAALAAFRTKPFEYIFLRTTPQPWRDEDSLLIGYALLLDLHGDAALRERQLLTLRESLGPEALAFFAPTSGPRDAALDGSTTPLAPIPTAKVLNLRPGARVSSVTSFRPDLPTVAERELPGSNAFALAGAHTANGAGLVANDMHLDLRIPNTWYRASLVWTDAGTERRVTGITVPGGPVIIAGSNGHVAWGFTNSRVDTSDLVVISTGISPELYRAFGHDAALKIETRTETIAVKGGPPVTVDYRWTIWGPIVGTDAENHPLAQHWVGHQPGAINFSLLGFETLTTTAEIVSAAHRAGLPTLNLVVADAHGDIAWTIAGPVPKRIGYDGRLPVSWNFGDRRWEGLLPPDEVPAVFAARTATGKEGRLWSANQRQLGGPAAAILSEAGGEAMRAAQIRDDLAPLERATPRDLLAIQLDDRALALERWQKFLLGVLTPEVVAGKSQRAELRALVEKWEGRASVESVSYRLVRTFRQAVANRVFDPIFAPCVAADKDFNWALLNYEEPLWTLMQEKPIHLLDPQFANWDALLVRAVDDTLSVIAQQNTPLAEATWGKANTARIAHPLSRALPSFLTGWLRLPADPLPGGNHMPRVQRPAFGASERFVVSPGHEEEGIFHMPGGQSGHPLSPYFQAGHAAWVKGEPTPFLPGKAEHTLTLHP